MKTMYKFILKVFILTFFIYSYIMIMTPLSISISPLIITTIFSTVIILLYELLKNILRCYIKK